MKKNINIAFLFGTIILVGLGVYFIFKPFLIALFTAFVFWQLFKGWYHIISKKLGKFKSTASLITCLIIFSLIVIPLILTIGLIAKEANDLYQNYQDRDFNLSFQLQSHNTLLESYGFKNGIVDLNSVLNFGNVSTESAKNVSSFFFNAVKKTYQGTSHLLFIIFVTFFSLYYLFKDGDRMMQRLMAISPLPNNQEKILLNNFVEISKATLKGSLVIAIVQAILMGITFWITGVSAPAIWGLITAIVSLIPLIGVVLVWAPVGIIMLLMGNVWQSIVIFIIGGLVVSSVDNVLRPKLVGDASSLHPLLVLLSTLGGIIVFGMMGFIIGPVIVVLLLSLLKIYELEFKKELKEIN